MRNNVLVSLTSIPRRISGSSLDEVIASLLRQDIDCDIAIHIPYEYRKWGKFDLPEKFTDIPRIRILRPQADYGPATKLLGALEYARDHPEIEHIITVDDDVCFQDKSHLRYLLAYGQALPGHAITVGGIRLKDMELSSRKSLRYRDIMRYVDIPAGYKGVVYPARKLLASPLPFELRHSLPDGIFHDDDAYFGILLNELSIPLLSVPSRPGSASRRQSREGGASAVAEGAGENRQANEMNILRYVASRGQIGRLSRRKLPPAPVLLKSLNIFMKGGLGLL